MLIVPRDKENQEYYRASEIQATDILQGAAGLDVLGRHEEIGRLHRMLDKACGFSARLRACGALTGERSALCWRPTLASGNSERASAVGVDALMRLAPPVSQACGGNGRPERYETAEMRGTPF